MWTSDVCVSVVNQSAQRSKSRTRDGGINRPVTMTVHKRQSRRILFVRFAKSTTTARLESYIPLANKGMTRSQLQVYNSNERRIALGENEWNGQGKEGRKQAVGTPVNALTWRSLLRPLHHHGRQRQLPDHLEQLAQGTRLHSLAHPLDSDNCRQHVSLLGVECREGRRLENDVLVQVEHELHKGKGEQPERDVRPRQLEAVVEDLQAVFRPIVDPASSQATSGQGSAFSNPSTGTTSAPVEVFQYSVPGHIRQSLWRETQLIKGLRIFYGLPTSALSRLVR
jgi:hypothetical protein